MMKETTILLLDVTKTKRESLEKTVLRIGSEMFVVAFESEADVMRYLRDDRADLILVASSDDGGIFASAKSASRKNCQKGISNASQSRSNVNNDGHVLLPRMCLSV